MAKHELLITKAGDYRELIAKASKKLGVTINTFLRISAIEKANNILSNHGSENV